VPMAVCVRAGTHAERKTERWSNPLSSERQEKRPVSMIEIILILFYCLLIVFLKYLWLLLLFTKLLCYSNIIININAYKNLGEVLFTNVCICAFSVCVLSGGHCQDSLFNVQ
jgi:hypothetical protein